MTIERPGDARHGIFQSGRAVEQDDALILADQAPLERLSQAAKVAAPSGQSSSPSLRATSSRTVKISPSATAMANPLLSRIARRIRKSPMATGTRIPAATVSASRHSSAWSAPFSHARTMGAHPVDCTATMRGRFRPIQPISSSSRNAFHMPISPVPPPVG